MLGYSVLGLVALGTAGADRSEPPVVEPPGPVDVTKISPARIVIFEGSGSRVTPFEGSGSRVVRFE